jgi:uncharacterized protein (DUF2147 family)
MMSARKAFRRVLILTSIAAFVLMELSSVAQSAADAILGEWISPEKDGKFLFYKSNGKYYGKVSWLKEPNDASGKPKTDAANDDPAKRSVPMMGLIVFSGFVYDDEEKEWIDGKVYDARNGDLYSCRLRLVSNLLMEVRGYILFSWLGKSAYFTRY